MANGELFIEGSHEMSHDWHPELKELEDLLREGLAAKEILKLVGDKL